MSASNPLNPDQFTPTEEQEHCVDAATQTTDSLLLTALAGAAKTSTLVLMAKALGSSSILCLAFNSKIAEEMRARLPANCTARTLNSLGHSAWGRAIGKRLVLNKDKTHNIVEALLRERSKSEKEEIYENLSAVYEALRSAKSSGYVPTGHFQQNAKPLIDDSAFFGGLDEELPEVCEDLVVDAMVTSIEQAFGGIVDFDDQVYMPTIFPASFDFYPIVMIDEAQDLSPLNHAMLRKICPPPREGSAVRRRLIAVGDPCQGIYGFRGAMANSMDDLQQHWAMRELTLTISFRCPIAVVKEAQWRAPAMRWADWAKPGSVVHKTEWDAELLGDNGVILCRNNAPLFNLAMKLLVAGLMPEIVGNNIGKSLIKTMRKLGPLEMTREQVFAELEKWTSEKLEKSRNKGAILDQSACMRVFIEQGKTLDDAITYAEHLFSRAGNIKMMTGHKSKGLEFENVFILDEFLLRKDSSQDRNLRYVMITRARETLTYITSEGFIG